MLFERAKVTVIAIALRVVANERLDQLKQDADVVVGLYRDELVHPDSDDRGLLELIVLKNRHAGEKPPATFKAVWYRGRYGEWDRNSYADHSRPAHNGTVSANGSKQQPA